MPHCFRAVRRTPATNTEGGANPFSSGVSCWRPILLSAPVPGRPRPHGRGRLPADHRRLDRRVQLGRLAAGPPSGRPQPARTVALLGLFLVSTSRLLDAFTVTDRLGPVWPSSSSSGTARPRARPRASPSHRGRPLHLGGSKGPSSGPENRWTPVTGQGRWPHGDRSAHGQRLNGLLPLACAAALPTDC